MNSNGSWQKEHVNQIFQTHKRKEGEQKRLVSGVQARQERLLVGQDVQVKEPRYVKVTARCKGSLKVVRYLMLSQLNSI